MKLSEIQTFEEAESYLYETPKFTVKSTPEMTRTFYEYLGCPGEDKKIVHVAGTNGKGSVCTYMRNILSAHGKRCACFTSPHLVSICERFRIDNLLIGKDDFLSCFRKVAGALQAVKEQAGMEEYHPSYFEYLFFMAMVWFEEKGAEYIILETGLGGRLDATNVIRKPALCIITKIGLDHTEYLGDTLEAVAREKAVSVPLAVAERVTTVAFLPLNSLCSNFTFWAWLPMVFQGEAALKSIFSSAPKVERAKRAAAVKIFFIFFLL